MGLTAPTPPARPPAESATATATAITAYGVRRLWSRQIDYYPPLRQRQLYLAIVVISTIYLYYALYTQGAVATQIIRHYHYSFTSFVVMIIAANVAGAFASLFAGLVDRWGRANLVAGGLLVVTLIALLGLPNAPSRLWFSSLITLLAFVEGIVLVATPALVRDFSPQIGRGFAMGFWALGPVLGSLTSTMVSSNTLDAHPDWRFQFHVCGIVGLTVSVLAAIGLRELTPSLRDQLMVSLRDRALIEARAAGTQPTEAGADAGMWGRVIRFRVVAPSVAIGVFLLLYYTLVGFVVVYFSTVYGYSESRANALANWFWIANATALVVSGLLSDGLRVRKPFMVLGMAMNAGGSLLFSLAATHAGTGYYTLAGYFVLMSVGGGMAYVAWMAAFTETVEKISPAATAPGLAIWGWILRLVVAGGLVSIILILPATSTLVDHGQRVRAIAAAHPNEVAVLSALDPASSAALSRNPDDIGALSTALREVAAQQGASPAQAAAVSTAARARAQQLTAARAIDPATLSVLERDSSDLTAAGQAIGEIVAKLHVDQATAVKLLTSLHSPAVRSDLGLVQRYGNILTAAQKTIPADDLAYLSAHGARVADAERQNPREWQRWWWVCIGGQVFFLPFIFVLTGRWSPRRAREDERQHEQAAARELAALRADAAD
ncbi:Major facilitator superfamily MFS_1 [Frankia sp. AiPs1]|uniref:MFS transporter n=1 Tax=Frankia sp. AiPa1 TaxID=573492 RepID=UPI00202B6D6F|nr:MFS transporter [Frankia sp. AiPa1]MCL9758624.1 MFS transporter [Frankia sp. AiPa1]